MGKEDTCRDRSRARARRQGLRKKILQHEKIESARLKSSVEDTNGYFLYKKYAQILRSTKEKTGHGDRVWFGAWTHDGNCFATCGADKAIRLWRQQRGADGSASWQASQTLDGIHDRTIRRVAWSPTGRILAAASFDATISIWEEREDDLSSLKEFQHIANLEGHENEVKGVSWDASGALLASCSRDKSVWVWEMEADKEFECVSVGASHSQDVKTVQWHPNRELFASASYDDTVKIWMNNDDDWYCSETLSGHDSTVWDVCFDTTGTLIASCSDDKSILVWQYNKPTTGREGDVGVRAWEQMQKLSGDHSRTIYSVSWSPSGLLASGGADNSVHIYRLDESEKKFHKVLSLPKAHAADVNCVTFRPVKETDGSELLASCGDDGKIRFWRIKA